MGRTRTPAKAAGRSYNEQIINSLTSGVMAVDADGVVITANPAAGRHLEVDPRRLGSGARLDAIPHVQPFLAILREVRGTRRAVQRRELLITCPDGRQKEIGLSASHLEGPEPFNGVIFLFVDMTERRRIERAAELSQQLATIGELTAGVVHELRNPISVIRGMAELLLRKLGPHDERRKTTETIFDEALHLERSIAQFLGFARPFELEPLHCHATDIMERTVHLCRRHAQDKGVRLGHRVEAGMPELRVDPARLAQALANIVNNGIDAVAAGGEVAIHVRADGQEALFEVLDNGPGIHLEPGQDLFQPFFTRKEDGTGLGLAIVHRIVTAHHGTVAYGNRDGGGARFEVRVPFSAGGEW